MLIVTTPTVEGYTIKAEATGLGANAILGVDLDYETIQVGQGGGMLMVSATGTAVSIE